MCVYIIFAYAIVIVEHVTVLAALQVTFDSTKGAPSVRSGYHLRIKVSTGKCYAL